MRLCVMDFRYRGSPAALGAPLASPVPGAAGPDGGGAEAAVTALYEAHALGLVRLAYVMPGDRAGAEDVVREAFGALYRRWDQLADKGRGTDP